MDSSLSYLYMYVRMSLKASGSHSTRKEILFDCFAYQRMSATRRRDDKTHFAAQRSQALQLLRLSLHEQLCEDVAVGGKHVAVTIHARRSTSFASKVKSYIPEAFLGDCELQESFIYVDTFSDKDRKSEF
eukprot:509551-Hanusia_phi.AAC.1